MSNINWWCVKVDRSRLTDPSWNMGDKHSERERMGKREGSGTAK